MPSASEHQEKCDHNRAFLNAGLVASNPCWAATVAFYVAVHLVEKLASANKSRPIHHTTHFARELWISSHAKHKVIFNEYEVLRDASHISRYQTLHKFNRMYSATTVQNHLIDTCLTAIEDYVAKVFSQPASPSSGG